MVRILLILFLLLSVYPQNSKEGYLARYNLETDSIEVLDQLQIWQESDDSLSYYSNAFTYKNKEYVFRFRAWLINDGAVVEKKLIDLQENKRYEFSAYGSYVHVIGIQRGLAEPIKTNTGIWLFQDLSGKLFIDTSGTVINVDSWHTHKLTHIIGKIDSFDISLMATDSFWEHEYYVTDPDEYPDYSLGRFNKVFFDRDGVYDKVRVIKGDLYLASISGSGSIYLLKRSGYTFKTVKALVGDYDQNYIRYWKYKNERLIVSYPDRVSEFYFNEDDTSFTNEKILAEGTSFPYVDNDFNFFAFKDSTFVNVYDAGTGELYKAVDLTGVKHTGKIFLNHPYLYFHKYASVSGMKNDIILKDYNLSQNYPNPFNPATKIKFTIPTSPQTPLLGKERGRGEVTKLVVYDALGREVSVLINESKPPGTYEVEFDGSGLVSGVYFYRMTSGNYVETKKMVLIR